MKTITRTVKGTVKRTATSKGVEVQKKYQASMYEASDWMAHKEDILKLANAMFAIRQDDKERAKLLRSHGDHRYKNGRPSEVVKRLLTLPKEKRDIAAVASLLGLNPLALQEEVDFWEQEGV